MHQNEATVSIIQAFRRQVFDAFHCLAHPGIRATQRLISTPFLWPSMQKDVRHWTRTCLAYQRAKVHLHTSSPSAAFPLPEARFRHIHIDLVGPLPPSSDSWEPSTVSPLHTIPCSNGLVERLHRQLKAALKTSEFPERWSEHLPLVLLGIRSAIKDCGASAADLLYGGPLRLPGEFFAPGATQPLPDPQDFATRLSSFCATLRAPSYRPSSDRRVFVHPDLATTTHVFVRHDGHRQPLQNPYDGPYLVQSHRPKSFTLLINGRSEVVSTDRIKPAYMDIPSGSAFPAPVSSVPSPVTPVSSPSRRVHRDSKPPICLRP
ncbi:uncharacterized protein LOC135387718 [Ornithodoros turicata]|uniref:uncharacterized protein LOC135387718 n=1 Tax=Ornithodoros turicata TaxID=34597 RepID=UPI003139E88C